MYSGLFVIENIHTGSLLGYLVYMNLGLGFYSIPIEKRVS